METKSFSYAGKHIAINLAWTDGIMFGKVYKYDGTSNGEITPSPDFSVELSAMEVIGYFALPKGKSTVKVLCDFKVFKSVCRAIIFFDTDPDTI